MNEMDIESGDMASASLQKPTSLPLRRSNNRMMDHITSATGFSHRLLKSLSTDNENTTCPVKSEIEIVNEELKSNGDNDRRSIDESCAMFGQIIDNEDETWDILSNASSWESTFPKEILSASNSTGTGVLSDSEDSDLPPDWKKICDSAGSYYWNVRTGRTQLHTPISDVVSASAESNGCSASPIETGSVNSREGHMFVVRSLGWLPMDSDSLKPDISSAAVNACIRHLSNNRTRLLDGIGVWGEGKDLMLQIIGDQLKIVDPSQDTILQTQSIKHIRLWGVGRDNSFDFAYVVRSPTTKLYQCHVFRCDNPAQAIAKQVHSVCSHLVRQKKLLKQSEKLDNQNNEFPVATSEQLQLFEAQYVGCAEVESPVGIDVVKQAISSLTTNSLDSDFKNVSVGVSVSTLVVKEGNSSVVVNCRMRFLSFMGIGDDVKYFGFISVLGNHPTCYVLRCEPNAAKLAVAVQEACLLRYQKAIDSNQGLTPTIEPKRSKSFKAKFAKVFSGFRKSGS